MRELVRLLLVSYLEPRDSVVDKDGILSNCYAEQNPEGPMIVKRPGNEGLGSLGTTGQGAFWHEGCTFYVADNTLFACTRLVTMSASVHAGGA